MAINCWSNAKQGKKKGRRKTWPLRPTICSPNTWVWCWALVSEPRKLKLTCWFLKLCSALLRLLDFIFRWNSVVLKYRKKILHGYRGCLDTWALWRSNIPLSHFSWHSQHPPPHPSERYHTPSKKKRALSAIWPLSILGCCPKMQEIRQNEVLRYLGKLTVVCL